MVESHGEVDQDKKRADATVVPAAIVAPPTLEPCIRYALQTMLRPHGIELDVLPAEQLPADRPSIVYAPAEVDVPSAALRFDASPAVADYYDALPADLPDSTEPLALFADDQGRPDQLASAFFWLNGTQEYVLRPRDEHGRFLYEGSFTEKLNIVDEPVVDGLSDAIATRLADRGVVVRRPDYHGRAWALCPTHDIDYIRRLRPGIIWRDLRRTAAEPAHLRRVLHQQLGGDPYRRSLYTMMREVQRRGGTATWFFKAGASSVHDVPYRLPSAGLQRFVEQVRDAGSEIGLHPSYHAAHDPRRLADERRRLAEAFGAPPTSIRNHYLRYDIARTPQLQQAAGFSIDTTLGFPDREGFRFGTCRPFRLFDLRTRRELDIIEAPLTFMDAALFNRTCYTVDEAIDRTWRLMDTCRRYGGICVGLWHNVVDDTADFPGRHRHFIATLDHAAANNAAILSLQDALG